MHSLFTLRLQFGIDCIVESDGGLQLFAMTQDFRKRSGIIIFGFMVLILGNYVAVVRLKRCLLGKIGVDLFQRRVIGGLILMSDRPLRVNLLSFCIFYQLVRLPGLNLDMLDIKLQVGLVQRNRTQQLFGNTLLFQTQTSKSHIFYVFLHFLCFVDAFLLRIVLQG